MIARGRVLDFALGGLLGSQLVVAAWLVPAAGGVTFSDGTPVGAMCLSRSLFGVPCPFCGMTRSFVALAHGDLRAAFAWHPAGPVLFVAMLACVVAIAVAAARRARPLVQRRGFWQVFQLVAYACIAIGLFNVVRS